MTVSRTHEVRVHAQGRIVIPAELRQDMELREGEALIVRLERGRLILERRADVRHRLLSVFHEEAGAGTSVDETADGGPA